MALSSHGDAQYVYETVKLQPEEEYRIYLKPEEWIRLWMVHGTAEAFGTELRAAKRNEKYGQSGYSQRSRHHSRKNKHKSKMSIDEIESNPLEKEEVYKLSDSYLFSNTNVSIYTFNGSTLYIKYERGHCEHKFSTKETAYQAFCNYNAALTNMRRAAEVHQVSQILKGKLSEKPSLPKIAAEVKANDFSLNEHKILDLEMMKQIGSFGPRVLVIGAANSGKASMTKILANYALRSGHYPLVVDLDCSLNMISIPGTIAAVSICEPIDVENGFNHSHASSLGKRRRMQTKEDDTRRVRENDDEDEGIKEEAEMNPIIYFYGDDHPDRRLKVYEKCVEKLALAIKKRMLLNLENRASGLIVKCHGAMSSPSDGAMMSVLNNVIKLMHIDTVLVIDDELTLNYLRNKYRDNLDAANLDGGGVPHHSQSHGHHHNHRGGGGRDGRGMAVNPHRKMKNDLASYWKRRFMAIEKAVKSGGVVVREQSERLAIGRNIIRNYFYGPNNNYRPLSCDAYPVFLKMYQIGSAQTQNDLLPADQRSVVESFGVLPVRFDASLRGQILAVLHIDNGIVEKEQYQIEREINMMMQQHEDGHGGSTQFNVNGIIQALISYDEDNEEIMYNSTTGQQISRDPFEGNVKRKNKMIRSSNVMGFVHVQEIKNDPHARSIGGSNIAKLTLLNPCQNKLPLKCLLKGHINWHDR